MEFTSQVNLPVTKHNRCKEESGQQRLALKALCQQESTKFFPPKASSEYKTQWFVLQLGPCYTIAQLIWFWSLFLREICVHSWQWRFIRSLLMFEKKKPLKFSKRKIQGRITERFLWRDRLSTADSEISPRMHRESAKGSGAIFVHRNFSFPT